MPATLVWKLPNRGALDQVQVGAADIVATISAANSARDWISGLDDIRNVVSNFPRLLGQSNNTKSLLPQTQIAAICLPYLHEQWYCPAQRRID
jgi:hypothetical protein